MSRFFGVKLDRAHMPTTGDNSWDGDWTPVCSCGWKGIPIEAPRGDLVEPFKALEDVYGRYLASGFLPGNANDSLIQVLHHISYDPTYDLTSAEQDYLAVKNHLAPQLSDEELLSLSKTVEEAARELIAARRRATVWATTQLPTVEEQPEDVRKLRMLISKSFHSKDEITAEEQAFIDEGMAKVHALRKERGLA